jgi:uncharacterized membrane protein
MDAVRMVLVLLLAVVVSRVLARLSPIELPLPLLQIGIGAALSFVIGFNVRLDPDVFLLLFIAPLLFLDGWRIPKGALRRSALLHAVSKGDCPSSGRVVLSASDPASFTPVEGEKSIPDRAPADR